VNSKQFNVGLALGGSTVQAADYFRIEQGCLCFRNHRAAEAYPSTVMVYAPGQWLTVELVPEIAYQETRTLGVIP
jgi:hypothetical protein